MADKTEYVTFERYLTMLPAEVVFRHLLPRDGQKRGIMSSSLIKDLARQCTFEKSLKTRFETLSPEARLTCACAYLFGRRGVPAPVLHGFDDELLSSFLVFAGRVADGTTRYYGFEDFGQKLMPVFADIIVSKARVPVPKDHIVLLPWFCLTDIMVCANLASLGMLDKTKKGAFSKNAESSFAKYLHASHDLPYTEDSGRVLVACVDLLLSYAVSRELIDFTDGVYRASSGKLLDWLSKGVSERYSDFCTHAMETVPLWNASCIESMFGKPESVWLSANAFPEEMKKDAVVVMALLWYCGCCTAGKAGGGMVFSRAALRDADATISELPGGRIMLLPDFSAVLSREVLPEELYWFTRVGAVVSFDRVYKGAIRRDVINNSLSEGLDEKKIVSWLVSWKAPHNVVETVKEWMREFSRIYLTTEATVLSFDEKATRQLMTYEPLRRLVAPAQPHSAFVIRRGHEEEVGRILMAMGFDPRKPGGAVAEKRRAGAVSEAGALPGVVPVVNFSPALTGAARPVKAGKYGEKLKELDISDLLHVLDYAVLMGHGATFEYLGSPYVKAGTHTVNPVAVHKTKEPFLEAEVPPRNARKKFLLKKIKRIGVESV
jgi:hypothetical protein